MRVYESDREAFYQLACDDLGGSCETTTRVLAEMARHVRLAVRDTYRIDRLSGNGMSVVASRRVILPIPDHLVAKVKRFLLEIDGKGSSDRPGKDYEGQPASEAEVRFKLGDSSDSKTHDDHIRARDEARPVLFTVREEDLLSLRHLPPYVTHGLMKCADKTLLAPTAVYRGLSRGNQAPLRLRDGWAVCGKPPRAYDNGGRAVDAPAGMLYMVFADADANVFDWDWVAEDPDSPGHPANMDLRFGNILQQPPELVLGSPAHIEPGKFDPTKPTLSSAGDCVFCYMSDHPSFAERINEDLTVFYSLADRDTVTGFKIKNVQRILTEQQALQLQDAPGLNVLILPVLRRTLQLNQQLTIKLFEIIIAALVNVKISLPKPVPDRSKPAAVAC
jgi:hypothetical protein